MKMADVCPSITILFHQSRNPFFALSIVDRDVVQKREREEKLKMKEKIIEDRK